MRLDAQAVVVRALAVRGGGGGSGGSNPPITDIKSFIDSKDPKNGTQFAAATAYFYRFLARDSEKKDAINSDDLLDAYRKAERDRPVRPTQTLIDAYADGVFDKAERGSYRLNTVGENLVAMVLLGKEGDAGKSRRGRGRKKSLAKKSGRRMATKVARRTVKKTAKKGTRKGAKKTAKSARG